MLVKVGLRKPPELGRDLAKSRHDQASPCPERVNKVNCVPRTARRKLQPFTKYPPEIVRVLAWAVTDCRVLN